MSLATADDIRERMPAAATARTRPGRDKAAVPGDGDGFEQARRNGPSLVVAEQREDCGQVVTADGHVGHVVILAPTADRTAARLDERGGNLSAGQGIVVGVDSLDPDGFLAGEYPRLLRTAFLLTGQRAAAQDLAQETAVRLLAGWRRVVRADNPSAYARKVMLNVHLKASRRAWRGEEPAGDLPERAADRSAFSDIDDRDAVLRALALLPARQRAAVVLRHYDRLSETEAAELLGCSVGNVKSLTSRGLAALRASFDEKDLCHDR